MAKQERIEPRMLIDSRTCGICTLSPQGDIHQPGHINGHEFIAPFDMFRHNWIQDTRDALARSLMSLRKRKSYALIKYADILGYMDGSLRGRLDSNCAREQVQRVFNMIPDRLDRRLNAAKINGEAEHE